MSRLSELQQNLAEQKMVVNDLAAQVEHSTGEETRRLLRKQQRASLAAQAIQNELDAVLHRVAYFQVARRRAQENLAAIESQIASMRAIAPATAADMER